MSVHFVVTLPERKMQEALATGLLEKFKLRTKVSISERAGRGRARWLRLHVRMPATLLVCLG